MRKILVTLLAGAVLLLASMDVARAQTPTTPAVGSVLFQDSFEVWGDANQRVESTWSTWSTQACECEANCACHTPEYKQANQAGAYPDRVHSGRNAQQYFTRWAGHNGGVYKVFQVPPGALLEVHAWGMAWSSSSDDARSYDGGQDVRMRIGVDPNGGTNPSAPTVLWGEAGNPPNVWQEVPPVKVTAGPLGQVTVFLGSNPKWPLSHNDIYWDDVYAIYNGQAAPVLPATQSQEAAANSPPPLAPPDPVLEGLVSGPPVPANTGGTGMGWTIGLVLVLVAFVMSTIIKEEVR